MISTCQEAKKHLEELGAFLVPNPIVAKAIALQRLLKIGIDELNARRAIENVMAKNVESPR